MAVLRSSCVITYKRWCRFLGRKLRCIDLQSEIYQENNIIKTIHIHDVALRERTSLRVCRRPSLGTLIIGSMKGSWREISFSSHDITGNMVSWREISCSSHEVTSSMMVCNWKYYSVIYKYRESSRIIPEATRSGSLLNFPWYGFTRWVQAL